jgi:hypothetical protein
MDRSRGMKWLKEVSGMGDVKNAHYSTGVSNFNDAEHAQNMLDLRFSHWYCKEFWDEDGRDIFPRNFD